MHEINTEFLAYWSFHLKYNDDYEIREAPTA